jgi:branched-chain amino acid transport system permease protein
MSDLIRRRPEPFVLVAVLLALPLLPKDLPLGIVALGLASGASLALHSLGVVLIHRSQRFFSFAQVQIGAVAATIFTTLVNARPLIRLTNSVCPPCVERLTPTVRNANYIAAIVLSLAAAALLGWLVHAGILRRLGNTARLVLTVATIFVVQLLGGLQSATVRYLTTETQRVGGVALKAAPPPVTASVTIGPAVLRLPELAAVAAAALAVLLAGLWLRRTAAGTAVRASSANGPRAQMLGVDVAAVQGRVWAVAGLLSGVAGVLGAMAVGSAGGLTGGSVGVLVRILAVAVVARMTSLPITAAAAAVLGIVDGAVRWSLGTGLPVDGGLVLVIAALLLLQRAGGVRSDEAAADWPAAREPRAVPAVLRAIPSVRSATRMGAAALAMLVLGLPYVLSPSQTDAVAVAALYAIIGLSLLILTGWSGQVSLGQLAFAAVGGWVAASTGWPLLLALPAGALVGGAVAVLVGLPALRLRGLYLAVSTLAFGLAASAILLDPRYLGGRLHPIKDQSVLGLDLGQARPAYYVATGALVLAALAVRGLRNSRTGRVLIAARDNEPAAQAMGIDLVRARLIAFAASGVLAAAAGVLFAYQQGGVQAESFGPEQGIVLFTFTVIGGLGSLAGPLVGFTWYALLALTSSTPVLRDLATGGGGLLLLLLLPGGLAQGLYALRDAALQRVARRRRLTVPGFAPDAGDEQVPIAPSPPIPRRYALDGQWALAEEPVGG